MALLYDVDANEATKRPLKERHTIWELVLHINAWRNKVRQVLKGEEMNSLPEEEDWPPIRDTTQASWEATIDELERVHGGLIETISRFDEARLGENVPGASYTFYHMLHGLVQHDLYHAGQIAILKKK